MKKIFSVIVMMIILLFLPFQTDASVKSADSYAINGYMPDGTKETFYTAETNSIHPYALLGVEYIRGAYKTNRNIITNYQYIYGTSVDFIAGARPSYTLTVTKSKTANHTFDVSAMAAFDVGAVATEVKGSYGLVASATIYRGETWNTDFVTPGTYNLSWYMRAHQYEVHGLCRYLTTDSSNGKIMEGYLGRITLPTDEVHLSVTN